MKEVKYIPGDLVLHNDIVSKISTTYYDSSYVKTAYSFHHLDSNDTLYQDFDESYITPVPLTPAILEANGWKRDGGQYNFCFTSYTGDKVELTGFFIEMFKDAHEMQKYRYFQIAHEGKVIFGCFYCHQLQHLLFGLGLPFDLKV